MKLDRKSVKRLAIRLSALTTVVALGFIAIAHAQRNTTPSVDGTNASSASATSGSTALRVNVADDTTARAGSSDPFAAGSFKSQSNEFPDREPLRIDSHLSDRAAPLNRLRSGERDFPAAQVAMRQEEPADDAATDNNPPPKKLAAAPNSDPFGSRADQRRPAQAAPPDTSAEGWDPRPAKPAPKAVPETPWGENRSADSGTPERLDRVATGQSDRTSATIVNDRIEAAAQRPAHKDEFSAHKDEFSSDAAPQATFASDKGLASEGTGVPGNKQLEGSQMPQLRVVEKIAPTEVQVGKSATFRIKVRNIGPVIAQGLEVHDDVPKGTQLIKTTPPAAQGSRGELIWSLGALKPGDEASVEIELMPTTEGEIGSVASVQFRAEAAARTVATKPGLTMVVTSPKQVMVGDDVTLNIRLSNPGTGTATGIILEEKVPQGLKHAAGPELEFEVGDLKPGESRQLDLTLTTTQAGKIMNALTARGDVNLKVQQQVELLVVAPKLQIDIAGPTRRYLERPATYTISVSNPGTAAAKDVQIITHLPKGLKFVKADNSGQYDASTHIVVWNLEELPAAQTGSVTLVTLPIEAGEQKLRVEGKAQQGLADQHEQTVVIEALAAVMFEVADTEDPIEVGGQTTYEVHVVNQGSKVATNIQIVGLVPVEAKPMSAEGPTKFTIDGQRVVFEPLPRLAPKADTTFKVRVQGLQPGDIRFKVQMTSDDVRTPLTKEESTRVYADQ